MKNVPPLFCDSTKLEFLTVDWSSPMLYPFYACRISAGFPSPAEDYIDLHISIADFVTDNPNSTYFIKVHGDSMQDAHIVDGSILAVDKSLKATSGSIVVAVVNSEFTVKRLMVQGKKAYLVPENKKYERLGITEEMNF